MTRRRFYLFLIALLITTAIAAGYSLHVVRAANGEPISLIILHTNDFHGNLLPFMDKRMDTDKPVAGAAYMAAVINDVRRQNPGKVLLVDAGDLVQGTPISNLFKGLSAIEVMNHIKYDAIVVGNHEFDWQLDALRKMVMEANFPFLLANVTYEDKPDQIILGLKPYIIKEINGVKVGILGVVTDTTPSITLPQNSKGLKFLPPAHIVRKYIPEMRRKGANLIILLSHNGFDEDKELAELVRGIDVIVGGHSHTLLKEPVKVRDTIILQAGSNGRYVGKLELQIDPRTKRLIPNTEKSTLIPVLHGNLRPDPEIARIVAKYEDIIRPKMEEVLAVTEVDLLKHAKRSSTGELTFLDGTLGNLISDMTLKETGAQVAFYNTPGIRADIYKGNITLAMVYTVLPFENALVAFDIPGSTIRGALEHGASGNYSIVQVSGITADIDYSKPVGERVSNIKINGNPLEETKTYRAATVDFIMYGGDSFDFSQAKNPQFFEYGRDVLARYLKELKIITTAESSRLRVIGHPQK